MFNAQTILQNMIGNSRLMQNQQFRNAYELYKNGQSQELHKFVENTCKEFGTSYDEQRKKLNFPSN